MALALSMGMRAFEFACLHTAIAELTNSIELSNWHMFLEIFIVSLVLVSRCHTATTRSRRICKRFDLVPLQELKNRMCEENYYYCFHVCPINFMVCILNFFNDIRAVE